LKGIRAVFDCIPPICPPKLARTPYHRSIEYTITMAEESSGQTITMVNKATDWVLWIRDMEGFAVDEGGWKYCDPDGSTPVPQQPKRPTMEEQIEMGEDWYLMCRRYPRHLAEYASKSPVPLEGCIDPPSSQEPVIER
jgi:hypothetical protein